MTRHILAPAILALTLPLASPGHASAEDTQPCATAVEAAIRYSEKRDADMAYHGAPKTQAHWEKWNRVKANEIRGLFKGCLKAEAAVAEVNVDEDEALAAFIRYFEDGINVGRAGEQQQP